MTVIDLQLWKDKSKKYLIAADETSDPEWIIYHLVDSSGNHVVNLYAIKRSNCQIHRYPNISSELGFLLDAEGKLLVN